MSGITGTGYGDKHNWKDKGTEQMPIPQDRSTLWVCLDCNETFRHWYHVVPDIFQAMKDRGIREECIKE